MRTSPDNIIIGSGYVSGIADVVYPQAASPSGISLYRSGNRLILSRSDHSDMLIESPVNQTTEVGSDLSGSILSILTPYPGSNRGVFVRQFEVSSGSPVAVSTARLGDTASVPTTLLRLSNGSLLVIWYQKVTASFIDLRLAMLSGSTWSSILQVTVPQSSSTDLKVRVAACEHPSDSTIWCLSKRDGFPEIGLVRLSAGGGSLALASLSAAFISQSSDGMNGPESEFPFLAMIQDHGNSSLLLAYQRNDSRTFANPPFIKGASICVQRLSATGIKSVVSVLSKWVERVSPFSLSISAEGIGLIYPVIDEAALNVNSLESDVFADGAWVHGGLVLSGMKSPPEQNWFTFRPDRREMTVGTIDGSLHRITWANTDPIPPGPTPNPISVSVSPSSVTIHRKQSQQFVANIPANWSRSPAIGSISTSGLYKAPGNIKVPSLVTVTATDKTDAANKASAKVTLQ